MGTDPRKRRAGNSGESKTGRLLCGEFKLRSGCEMLLWHDPVCAAVRRRGRRRNRRDEEERGRKMTLVSVIMPTYKGKKENLERSIQSVISQTYQCWELIIIDDNQEEKYSKLVRKVIEKFNDPRIVYIKNIKNLGSAKARNEGIKKSKGQFITFLDDDDEYLPLKIESQLKLMEKEGGDFSLTDLNLFNDNGKLVRKRRHSYLKNGDKPLVLHLKYHLTGTDTFMFRREYLFKIGLFDSIDIGDEFYLMLKAIQNKGKLVYEPICCVKAYVHGKGIGLTAGDNKIKGEKQLYAVKRKFFSQLSKEDISYIKMRHYLVLLSCELKNRKIGNSLYYFLMAFSSNPKNFLKFCINRKEY